MERPPELVKKGYAKATEQGIRITTEGRMRLRELLGLDEKSVKTAARSLGKLPKPIPVRFSYDPSEYASVLAVLNRWFRSLNGKKVLEIGNCRIGFLKELHKRGARPFALDLQQHDEPFQGMNFQQGDLKQLKDHFEGEKFHAVVVRGVLESGSSFPEFIGNEERDFFEALKQKVHAGGLVLIEHHHAPGSLVNEAALEKHGFRVLSPQHTNPTRGQTTLMYIAIRKPH